MSRRHDPTRSRRRIWRWIHLALALLAGAPLAAAGATGAILGFAPELQRLQHPAIFEVRAEGPALPVAELARRLRAEHPDARLNHVMGFPEADRTWTGWLTEGEGATRQGYVVQIDPYTGRISRDMSTEGWLAKAERLHTSLAAGRIGRHIVAVSSVALIVLSITGLYLWWPLRRRTVARALRRRELLAWHNLVGIVCMPVLFAMALTGIEQAWSPIVAPALEGLSGTERPAPAPPSRPLPGAPEVPLARAIEAVESRFPNAIVTAFADTRQPTSSYMVAFRFPGELNGFGWRKAFVDRYTGEIVALVDAYEHSWGARWRQAGWQLHGGDAFGRSGRVIWSLASAVVPVLLITGLVLWRRRVIPAARSWPVASSTRDRPRPTRCP